MTLSELGLTAQPFKLLVFLGFTFGLIFLLIVIALFVLRAVGLMTMAEKLGIKNKWFGFVPFLDVVLLGRIAATYRGKREKRFKAAPVLLLIICLIVAALFIIAVLTAFSGMIDLFFEADESMASDVALSSNSFNGLIMALNLFFIAMAAFLVFKIIEIICLYRVFVVFAYDSVVTYIILSAIFGFLIPFFISAASKNTPITTYEEKYDRDSAHFTI